MIAPWRGESEWFPVSNPASCWDVDVREDGRSRLESASLQGAATSILVAPWLAHFGVHRPCRRAPLPPEFIYGSRLSPHSLILAVSLQLSGLRLHVCLQSAARFGSERDSVL